MSTAAPLKVNHGMAWSPASRLGRWTLGLAGLAVAATAVLAIAFYAGLEPAESFSDNWLLTATGLVVLGVALASVATGLGGSGCAPRPFLGGRAGHGRRTRPQRPVAAAGCRGARLALHLSRTFDAQQRLSRWSE